MQVKQFVHSYYNSNTYLLSLSSCESVWLIDAGNVRDIPQHLSGSQSISGVFLTHAHIDHICDIEFLLNHYPDCRIYTNLVGAESLNSPKLNLSFYHDNPVSYSGQAIGIVKEGDVMAIFPGIDIQITETPGHNPACLTFRVLDYMFTGDSFIPGFKVVSKLKGGDRLLAEKSRLKILSMLNPETVLCAGHGPVVSGASLIEL